MITGFIVFWKMVNGMQLPLNLHLRKIIDRNFIWGIRCENSRIFLKKYPPGRNIPVKRGPTVLKLSALFLLYKEPQAKPVGKRRSGSDEAENKELLLLK